MNKSPSLRKDGLLSLPGIGAFLAALLLLSGRWNFARVTGVDLGVFGEPRLYLSGALLFLMLLPGGYRPRSLIDRTTVNRIALPMCAFLGYMGMAALWSPGGTDLSKLAELAQVFILVIASLRICQTVGAARYLDLFWGWFLPVLLLFASLALLGGVGGGDRVAILGGGPNIFGRNMGLLSVAVLGAALEGTGGLGRIKVPVFLTILAASTALVVLSGSRGALIALLSGVAAVAYLGYRDVTRASVAVVLGTALVALFLNFTSAGSAALSMFQERVLRLGIANRYDSGREEIFANAWELGWENPFFGIGLDGFGQLGIHIYPHNLFLEAFCEGGLVGFALLCVCLGPSLWNFACRRSGPSLRDYGAFFVFLVSAQFSGDLFDSRGVLLFAALLPLLSHRLPDQSIEGASPLLMSPIGVRRKPKRRRALGNTQFEASSSLARKRSRFFL